MPIKFTYDHNLAKKIRHKRKIRVSKLTIIMMQFWALTILIPNIIAQNRDVIIYANYNSGINTVKSDYKFTPENDFSDNLNFSKKRYQQNKTGGITFTTEELTIWRERAANGPYKIPGDRFINSPSAYNESNRRADFFINNPGTDYVTDDPRNTGVDGYGEYLLSAAWKYLIDEDTTYGNAVHDHIVAQVQEPNLDYSTFTKLATGGDNVTFGAVLVNKIFFAYDYTKDLYTASEKTLVEDWIYNAARFFQKSANERTLGLVMKFRSDNGKYDTIAEMLEDQNNQIKSHYYWDEGTNLNYEFKGVATGSISDYTVQSTAKRQYFYDNATYASEAEMLADQANHVPGECYAHAGRRWGESYIFKGTATGNLSDYKFQRIWDVYSYFDYLSPTRYTHLDSEGVPHNKIAAFNGVYNNRTALWAVTMVLAGIAKGDDFMIDQAKLYHEEFLMFGTYPDGTTSEYRRNGDYGYPQQGSMTYNLLTIESFIWVARLLQKHKGDTSLFQYTTSQGIQGSEGGSKNLRKIIETVIEHCDSDHNDANSVRRYHDAVTEANLQDDFYENKQRRFLPEVVLSLANMYYREQRIRSAYLNQLPNQTPYNPSYNYPVGSVGHSWGGALGVIPNYPLMYFEMEGR
jgi:hypothetical protein